MASSTHGQLRHSRSRAPSPTGESIASLGARSKDTKSEITPEEVEIIPDQARLNVLTDMRSTVIDLGDEIDGNDKLASSMFPTVKVNEQTHRELKAKCNRALSSYGDKTSARARAPRSSTSSATAPISPPQNKVTSGSDNAEARNAQDNADRGVTTLGNARAENLQLTGVAHDGNVDNIKADKDAFRSRISAMSQKGRESVRNDLLLGQAESGTVLATSITGKPTPAYHQKPLARLATLCQPKDQSGMSSAPPKSKKPKTTSGMASKREERKATPTPSKCDGNEDETSLFIPEETSAPNLNLGKSLSTRRRF